MNATTFKPWHNPCPARPLVRMTQADLSTPRAINTLQHIGDIQTEKGVIKLVSGQYELTARNCGRWVFPKHRYDNAAHVAIAALKTMS